MRGAGERGPGGYPGPQVAPLRLLRRTREHEGVAFTVVVWVSVVAGAAVMSLVLLRSGAPDAVAVGLVLAALPVGPLVAAYMWLDRYEPEPRALLAGALAWGAVVATAVALLLQLLDQFFVSTSQDWSAAIVAPVTEELAKGLFVVLLLWLRRSEIDGLLDGLVYAGLVGVGFAFTENILYLAAAYIGSDDTGPGGLGAATGLFVFRGVLSPFAHPMFASCLGVGVGVAVTSRSPRVRMLAPLLGYLAAVLLHAAWNASAFLEQGRWFFTTYLFAMVPAFLLLVGFAVWSRRQERVILTRALADAAQRGLVSWAEVPWLVSLPARREARRYARATGGPPAAQALAEYQSQAVEFAFLHHRYLRGTAPVDVSVRAEARLARMAELRPYLLVPVPAGR